MEQDVIDALVKHTEFMVRQQRLIQHLNQRVKALELKIAQLIPATLSIKDDPK